ncbi:hypothetical protein PJP07_30360, partial [Mycobacterium kansasii]
FIVRGLASDAATSQVVSARCYVDATMMYLFYPSPPSILKDNFMTLSQKLGISKSHVDHTMGKQFSLNFRH